MVGVLAMGVACGEDSEDTVENVEVAEVATETEVETEAPTSALSHEEAVELLGDLELPGDVPIAAPEEERAEVPAGGCARQGAAQRVWPAASFSDAVAVGDDGLAIVGYGRRDEGEDVFVVTYRPGRPPRPVARERLQHGLTFPRRAAPAVAKVDDGRILVATSDLRGKLRLGEIHLGGQRQPWVEVAEAADQRYAPAVLSRGVYRGVAYVDSTGDFMRLRYVRLNARGEVLGREDLTPDGMGATAPTWIRGEEATLSFVDARDGYSPVLSLPFDTVAAPRGEASVLRPLVSVFDPPMLAVVRWGEGESDWMIGYTATGQSARTAVGIAGTGGGAEALVPGAAIGYLNVSVAFRQGGRPVFASDAPTSREANTPRELRIHVLDEERHPGPALVINEDGGLQNARMAEWRGELFVIYSSTDATWVQQLACDDGAGT